jgi:ATP-binding cassette subfamily C (CFTR/MRP) protein 1
VFLVRQNLFSLHVQVLSLISVALHLGYIVRWCINPITEYSIAGASLTFVSSIGVAFLLFVEHKRLIRPSSFISLYLLCRIIADSVQLRTIALRSYDNAITGVLSAEISIQCFSLILESWPETRSFDDSKVYSPEDTAGVFNRNVLWWLTSLFWMGNKMVLKQSDLFNLDGSIQSSTLIKQIRPVWQKSMYYRPPGLVNILLILIDVNKKRALLATYLSTLFIPWLQTVPPRAATIAFKYSQTFLLNDAVSYLAKPSAKRNKNDAYGLIGAAVLIYFGMAVSISPTFSFSSITECLTFSDRESKPTRKVKPNDCHIPRGNSSSDLRQISSISSHRRESTRSDFNVH